MEKEQESKKKLIIVHGWECYPEEGWFPWLKAELENRGWSVQVPAMPSTNQPEQARWVPYLVTIAGEVDKNTFLVGPIKMDGETLAGLINTPDWH